MKTTFILLFISITAFSQSKKELRAEIDILKSQQAQINLAHQIQIDQLTKKVDSLKSIITRQNDQYQFDQTSIVRLREELDKTKDSLNQVNSLLASKQTNKKEEKTKAVIPVTIEPDGNEVEITPTQRCTTSDASTNDHVKKEIRQQLKKEKKVGIEMRS